MSSVMFDVVAFIFVISACMRSIGATTAPRSSAIFFMSVIRSRMNCKFSVIGSDCMLI